MAKENKSPRRKSTRSSRKRNCPKGTRLLKRPVKEGSRTRYCTKPRKVARRKSSTRKSRRRNCKYGELKQRVKLPSGGYRYCKKAPKKSRRRKSSPKKSRRRKSSKCPKGTRPLKRPVKEGGRTRHCTKQRKSRRRKSPKCPKGTRLLKHPVKDKKTGKMRYCTKPRKSPKKNPKRRSRKPSPPKRRKPSPPKRRKPSPPKRRKPSPPKRRKPTEEPKGKYTCRTKIGFYGEEKGQYCDPQEGGEYATLKKCVNHCEAYHQSMPDLPDDKYSKKLCRDKWCTGPLQSKKWKRCYKKNAVKFHPDKNVSDDGSKNPSGMSQLKSEEEFKELSKCNKNSKHW